MEKGKSPKAKVDFFFITKESKSLITASEMVVQTLKYAWERDCRPVSGSVYALEGAPLCISQKD